MSYKGEIKSRIVIICINYIGFTAPVCFNTTSCDGQSAGDMFVSFDQCCFELSGVSYASSGQCLLCPTTGMYIDQYNVDNYIKDWFAHVDLMYGRACLK